MKNAGCIAALKAADQLLDGVEEPKATLRIIIDNMQYPITIEILHKVTIADTQVIANIMCVLVVIIEILLKYCTMYWQLTQ